MTRAYNFCAGPAALPDEVLEQAQAELLNWHGRGVSIMEMSHRSADYMEVAAQAEQDLRDLLAIPANYKVLFMQGGAKQQFSTVPLNLLGQARVADYIDTGIWSKDALQEGKRYAEVKVAASAEPFNYHRVPRQDELRLSQDAAYVHYCANETIGGLEFDYVPETEAPLVCDMSSNILSRPIDVSRFGVIYAGAQKNVGPAGICIVIVREDLLERALPITPATMTYQTVAKNDSMFNTPPTFSWYLSGLVFQWLKRQGGLTAIAAQNERKAAKLYQAIDTSRLYANPVASANRSIMNVPFTLADTALEKTFLQEAEANGLLNLKGHRSVGGMRASIYNAVPEQAVDALVAFMADFESRYYPG
ncbi:3-phosphoserine/phosphohydroxythreonine transaminase [Balneatrix alpica]|uniref:3-phosphoserine/phosphohydroxythreonine transaminase n=1 Tax=Balneatrix alpica TaxID=75684 RepID=UPI0027389DA3|nr:3-phosphoserine/phosphohydroxythreonine transaminase [Balneatrix alpica]